MRTRRLVKCFYWRREDFDDVELGPSTRLNVDTHRAQLVFDPNLAGTVGGGFPTTANLFVKSKLTEPKALRRWIGFEATIVNVNQIGTANALTGANFRLDPDDGNEYYWDGAAWAIATANDWNTEQEIADNIDSFDVATLGQRMRVVANLFTTDTRYTPQLVEVKLLMELVLESYEEDMIYRSLIPLLRDNVRPVARQVMAMPATGTTFNISAFDLEAGYNVVGVDAVFDYDALTADQRADLVRGYPGATTDLFSSFDLGTGVVTLNASVPLGTNLFVRFIYEPEVAVNTSQEFSEDARIPSLVLDDIAYISFATSPTGDNSVANKGAGTAIVVPSPEQGHIQFRLVGTTKSGVDQRRLMEEVNKFFATQPFVSSTGVDEQYRLFLIDEYAEVGEPGQDELHVGQAVFQIQYFRRWLRPSFDEFIATGLSASLET